MRTFYLALGISAIAATMIAATVVWFVHNDRERRALDDARDYIGGTQDADEATDDVRRVGACNWLRETFGGEGCGAAGPDAPVD